MKQDSGRMPTTRPNASEQSATDTTLHIMLEVLGDRRLAAVVWMQECQQRGVGLRAFCEGVPLLASSTLITRSAVTYGEELQHSYRRVMK